jgi:methyl-accepting chemotaxis protein
MLILSQNDDLKGKLECFSLLYHQKSSVEPFLFQRLIENIFGKIDIHSLHFLYKVRRANSVIVTLGKISMNFFTKQSIKLKILLIPLVGSVGFLLYLFLSLSAMNLNLDSLTNAKNVQFPLLQISADSLNKLEDIKATLGDAVSMGEEEKLTTGKQLYSALKSSLNNAAEIDAGTADEIRSLISELDIYFDHAYGLSKGFVDETADFSNLAEQSKKMGENLSKLQAGLNRFNQARNDDFIQAFEYVNSKTEETASIGIIVGIVTIVLLFLVAYPISSSTKKSIEQISDSMQNIAEKDGDLTSRIISASQDELGVLVKWFNTFIGKLQDTIKQTVNTALPLAQTATNIRELSNQSQLIFEKQLISSEQSQISVGEMNQSVERIAQNAVGASDSAAKAQEGANKGLSDVQLTIESIHKLSQSIEESSETVTKLEEGSNKVNVVLEVIKGIAEQTNLLALNAAIEAARAGEQGRGFAVVADEVRNLASRTQESTEEINGILEELQSAAKEAVEKMESSRSQVHKSVECAGDAGESLKAITITVEEINKMNEEISENTAQQKEISIRLVSSVSDIKNKTQESNEASEKLAKVSENLTDLSSVLESIATQFKV